MASISGQQNSGSIGHIFAMNVEQEVVGLDHQDEQRSHRTC